MVNLGTPQKPNWIPAELCLIEPGNAYRGKLSDKETAQMIRYACNVPRVNAEQIMSNGLPAMGVAPIQSPANGFNIDIDPRMSEIPGRELPPPQLTYKVGQARPQNGSWNILDVKFHRGANITSWWVLVIQDGRGIVKGPTDEGLRGLVDGFRAKLARSGLSLPSGIPRLLPPARLVHPAQDPLRTRSLQIIKDILVDQLALSQKPSFVLVLLENRDNFIYPGIKV